MSKSVSKFALAAGIVLAMAFTFSCSGDDGGDSNTGTCGGKKYDTTLYSCEKGEIVGYCRGKPYYPDYESCDNSGEIIDGAEISSSSLRNSSSSGGGSNISDLPKQVYLVETGYENEDLVVRKKERYEGNANIGIRHSKYRGVACWDTEGGGVVCACTNDDGVEFSCKEEDAYDTLPAGRIQAGQLSLNLPAINSKDLEKLEPCNDEYCQSNISIVPRNLTYVRMSALTAAIPGRSDCRIRPYRTKSGKMTRAQFYYFSESGSITGTETDTYDGYQTNFDMNFSKGWTLVYYDTYDNYRNLTTDIPKDGTWEWWLQCYDDDGGGGGVEQSGSSGVSTNANGDQIYHMDGWQVYALTIVPPPPYTGNANIYVDKYNFLAGRIINGKLSLDLPSINNFNAGEGFDEVGLSVDGCGLMLIGSTNGLVNSTLETFRNDLRAGGFFLYASRSGEFNAPDGTKLNLKKGWNLVYVLFANDSVTVAQPSGLTWEWVLNCEE